MNPTRAVGIPAAGPAEAVLALLRRTAVARLTLRVLVALLAVGLGGVVGGLDPLAVLPLRGVFAPMTLLVPMTRLVTMTLRVVPFGLHALRDVGT
jgi:hypothetical protein